MKKSPALLIAFLTFLSIPLFAQGQEQSQPQTQPQSRLPEIMNTGTLEEQMDYIHQRTIIYNNFRAIREDIFQGIRRNALDSLVFSKREITVHKDQIASLNETIDSISGVLQRTRTELNIAIENRDSMFFFGIPINKTAYNLILWAIILGLVILTGLILLLFQRNRIATRKSSKDLKELKNEFEEYRSTNREKMEKMVIDHFNEIKKLKGER